jgi:transposase-like protein
MVIMSKRYPPEVREKALRLALDHLDEYGSAYAAAHAIGPRVDVHPETLRVWIVNTLKQQPAPGAVTGIVIANPFYATSASESGIELPAGLELIQDSEHLICDLAEHHMLDDLERYTYDLRGFESARTSEALVCRPIASWRSHEGRSRTRTTRE